MNGLNMSIRQSNNTVIINYPANYRLYGHFHNRSLACM